MHSLPCEIHVCTKEEPVEYRRCSLKYILVYIYIYIYI